jgi:hypothetical protein
MEQKTAKMKTVTSSLKAIKYGVPQGSVLGHLLFLLFINDLPQVLSLNEKIQNVKNQIENWFHENRLIINTDKSKVLFFQGSRPIPSTRPLFCIINKEVVCSVDVKFLGICITEDLSWATHIQYVGQKLSKNIYLIKSLRDSLSQTV